MTKAQMASFNDDLGALGFVFQFITLAGFHADGLITARLSRVTATAYCMNLLDCTRKQYQAHYARIIMLCTVVLNLLMITHTQRFPDCKATVCTQHCYSAHKR
jgi:Isocitrate lyase family